MQVDLVLDNAKVYDVSRMEIASGQSFELLTDMNTPAQWFADHDEVLGIKVNGTNAELQAKEVGTSTLIIMSEAFQPIKTLTVSVVDAIISQATDLGLSSDQPTEKADKE